MYNTRQKAMIAACLKAHAGEHMTADQIHASLLQNGTHIGLTTIYRELDRLVNDGSAIKYTGLNTNATSYQYIGDAKEHGNHYHLICLDCGQLTHLSCSIIESFTRHIEEEHSFLLNSQKTVFYGHCASCAEKAPAK